MPRVVCFFQSRGEVQVAVRDVRLSDAAKLDRGSMWPTSFALEELTAADEKGIAALVKRTAR